MVAGINRPAPKCPSDVRIRTKFSRSNAGRLGAGTRASLYRNTALPFGAIPPPADGFDDAAPRPNFGRAAPQLWSSSSRERQSCIERAHAPGRQPLVDCPGDRIRFRRRQRLEDTRRDSLGIERQQLRLRCLVTADARLYLDCRRPRVRAASCRCYRPGFGRLHRASRSAPIRASPRRQLAALALVAMPAAAASAALRAAWRGALVGAQLRSWRHCRSVCGSWRDPTTCASASTITHHRAAAARFAQLLPSMRRRASCECHAARARRRSAAGSGRTRAIRRWWDQRTRQSRPTPAQVRLCRRDCLALRPHPSLQIGAACG
jgi:hypothetical protein